jgi:ribbon-helix-helix CopG family protein
MELCLSSFVYNASMLAKTTKLLAIRIPEAEKRRIKSLAASRGLSLQEAIRQAIELWAAQPQTEDEAPSESLPGASSGTGLPDHKR